jgi:hypothetical protein
MKHRSGSLRRSLQAAAATTLLVTCFAPPAQAFFWLPPKLKQHLKRSFEHVGTFEVPRNLPAGVDPSTVTSAEIVDVSRDGRTLLYTDSPTKRLGFVDIRDAADPRPLGALDLPGEPTSVATLGAYALVVVNTREDPDGDGPLNAFDAPSGKLLVVEVASRRVVHKLSLAGQPDSIAVSPDQRFAAIVIENERDEDENDGLIPQGPAGLLQVIELRGAPQSWKLESIDLTGLAAYAPSDPEPEFVDINRKNQAVVSLQENNHLVVIDLPSRKVVNHFSAGSATITNIDATEDELGPDESGVIEPAETITRRREPDAVAWIDDDTFATANEGDYTDEAGVEGGSRSFTLFNVDGTVEYESGSSFEHELVRAGHYPESRSENKGVEPEGVEFGVFDGRPLLFVGSERGNAVGVYEIVAGQPKFQHLLATGIGPEGIKVIPRRGLVAVSAETDGKADGFEIRSVVTLYALRLGQPDYPQLVSADDVDGVPVPWVAISGLAGDPSDKNTLYAVSDSYLAQAYIYPVDVAPRPAEIQDRIPVGEADGSLDLEGIAARPEGGFWLASEGAVDVRPNQLLRVDGAGAILETIELPDALAAQATSSGFEGVAVTGSERGGNELVWVVVQREWKDDAKGFVKLGRYDVAAQAWTFALYPLDAVESPNGGWVGLSELTLLPNGELAVVERDNQLAAHARIKRIYGIDPESVEFLPYGEQLPVLAKTLLRDVLDDLDAHSISTPDKLEGTAVGADGKLWLATDNDGVDENYGETLFFSLGKVSQAF